MEFVLYILLPIFANILIPLKNVSRTLFYVAMSFVAATHFYMAVDMPIFTIIDWRQAHFMLEIDSYSKIFIVLISIGWFLSIVYAYSYNREHFRTQSKEFFFYLNLLISIIILNACSASLVSLFFFYTLGIPIIYKLISLDQRRASILSAKYFFYQTFIPAVTILLPTIVFTYYLTGNLSFFESHLTFSALDINLYLGGFVLLLYLLGFSMNSVFPFHTWLPRTYLTPAPVSSLIHTIAAVKTASIATIKIVVYILGLDYVRELSSHFFTGGYIIYVCGITAVYTAYRALQTDDMKQRFSYSTVGQLSYIIMAILIGTPTGIMAATLHIVTHSIAKACLFYVAGFYHSQYHLSSVKRIGKIMPHTKFIAFVIAVCGLSISGFPFLAGYYSKDLMVIEEWHTGNYASMTFLIIGSVINLFYIVPVVMNALKTPSIQFKPKKIPLNMLITFVISMLMILLSSFYVHSIEEILD